MKRYPQIVFFEYIKKRLIGVFMSVPKNVVEIANRLVIVQAKSQPEFAHRLEQLHFQIYIFTGIFTNVID